MALLGKKIQKLRKDKGLTLEGLAQAIGSGKSYVWELENRDISPSGERLNKIAEELGVTPEYLTDDSRESADEDDFDQAFYRKYQKLESKTKKKINSILDAWMEED